MSNTIYTKRNKYTLIYTTYTLGKLPTDSGYTQYTQFLDAAHFFLKKAICYHFVNILICTRNLYKHIREELIDDFLRGNPPALFHPTME